jgi:hypothetical protein
MLIWLLIPVGLLSGINKEEARLSQKSRVSGGGAGEGVRVGVGVGVELGVGVGVGVSADWFTNGRKIWMISLGAKRSIVGVAVVIATTGMSVPVVVIGGVGGGSSISSLAVDGEAKPSKMVRNRITLPARMILLWFDRVEFMGIFYSKIDVCVVTRSEEAVW